MMKQRGISGILGRTGMAVWMLAGWLGFGLTTARAGTIIEIPPFIGDISEDWESFPNPPGEAPTLLESPVRIMGGSAQIGGPPMIIYVPGVRDFYLGSSGVAQVADGLKGMGVVGSNETATLVFETPVFSFGAYWGAATGTTFPDSGDPALITVRFFDESDWLLETIQFSYSRPHGPEPGAVGDGMLEWHGWSSTVPVKRISYTEDFVVIDGLRANIVPEPTLGLLVMGIMFVLKSRRFAIQERPVK